MNAEVEKAEAQEGTNQRRRVKIVSFNVAGIKNVLNYHPWNENKTFEAMFERLNADIVCFQETKIQLRDLTREYALVKGYNSFFTAPKHKKGYSGVAFYVKKDIAVLAAEEGLSGWLNSNPYDLHSKPYLMTKNSIGGYPEEITEKLGKEVDSEGRAIVLDLGWCVIIGLYCPANSTGDKSEFKDAYMRVLDARVRNLVEKEGRNVVVVGDLNVARELIDSADAKQEYVKLGLVTNAESMREFKTLNRSVMEEWKRSTLSRRIVNGWLGELSELNSETENDDVNKEFEDMDGAFGESSTDSDKALDTELVNITQVHAEGPTKAILQDTTRQLHPDRFAMYTCWNTKINARPGNFGSRIDYIMASERLPCVHADILPQLLGSDHCPIESVLEVDSRELADSSITPPRLCSSNLLQFRSSNIKNMFATVSGNFKSEYISAEAEGAASTTSTTTTASTASKASKASTAASHEDPGKRRGDNQRPNSRKRGKVQSKLTLFKRESKTPDSDEAAKSELLQGQDVEEFAAYRDSVLIEGNNPLTVDAKNKKSVESWSKILAPRKSPLCNHNLPCELRVTKKSGSNQGRSFWVCSKPTSSTESGTHDSRCSFFKWA